MADEPRASAAQAEYRLGLCLQKKGKQAEANKAFQNVIAKYHEQSELVSQARAFVASAALPKLLPAPWQDGEVLELIQTVHGITGLVMRYSIISSKANPGHWLLENNMSGLGAGRQTQVEVDKETMKPIFSAAIDPVIFGDSKITYQASQARLEQKGKEPKTVALENTTWDNEEIWALLRRLPLTPGYKTKLPVLSLTGMSGKIDIEVTGTEDVKTPAGTFHCYRIAADAIRQTFFISTDDTHYLVKIEMTVMSAELTKISHGPAGPATYTDEKLGFSLNTPEGWRVYDYDPPQKDLAMASLVDPEFVIPTALTVHTLEADYPVAEGMREHIQKEIDKDKTKTVRPDSWQTRQIGGRPAVSWVVDYTDLFNHKSVEYSVEIRGDKTYARFTSKLDPDADVATFEKRFDPIMDNLTIK